LTRAARSLQARSRSLGKQHQQTHKRSLTAAMGKGGTKFEGEAIGVRGKATKVLTGKEMRRNM